MHHILPDYKRTAFHSYGEDIISIHKIDKWAKASTLFLIVALGCCIYLYGKNRRTEKNMQNPSTMIKSQNDLSFRSPGIQWTE